MITTDEIIMALRVCNQPRGHRCSECPIFSKYNHTVCKTTVDRSAANAIETLTKRQEATTDDLKYYLENNEENGVVYIPRFVIEAMIKN